MKIHRAKFRDHAWKVGEAIMIDRERPVFILKLDIQIDDVGRNVIRSQTICDFNDSRLWYVTVTRLLISQSPLRRHWHSSSQPRICLHHLFWCRSIKHVVVQRSVYSAKGISVG